jgi:hypothetical protein
VLVEWPERLGEAALRPEEALTLALAHGAAEEERSPPSPAGRTAARAWGPAA